MSGAAWSSRERGAETLTASLRSHALVVSSSSTNSGLLNLELAEEFLNYVFKKVKNIRTCVYLPPLPTPPTPNCPVLTQFQPVSLSATVGLLFLQISTADGHKLCNQNTKAVYFSRDCFREELIQL